MNAREMTMMKGAILIMLSMLSISGAHAASQSFHGEATLAKALSESTQKTIDGVTWNCSGTKCSGEAKMWNSLDSRMRVCSKVAAAFGTLTAYSSHGIAFGSGDLNVCNRTAK